MKLRIVTAPVGDDPAKAGLYYGYHVLDVLKKLPEASIQVVCTSLPRWRSREPGNGQSGKQKGVLWDDSGSCRHHFSSPAGEYGWCSKCDAWKGHLGHETTPHSYAIHVTEVFQAIRRVLCPDGIIWVHLRDGYATHSRARGLKPKDLVGVPWRVALGLQEDGWWVRQDVIWAVDNPRPEGVVDRPLGSHDHILLLTKNPQYHFVQAALPEEAKHSLWQVSIKPWPPRMVEWMIAAGTQGKKQCVVLDPFSRKGLTGVASQKLGQNFIGIDLDADLAEVAEARLLGRKPPYRKPPPTDLIDELFAG